MAGRRGGGGGGLGLMAVVVAGPLLIFIAALGTRTGVWSYAVGHDLLAMRIGLGLAALGGLAAVAVLIATLRRRAPPWIAAVAIAVSATTLGGYAWQANLARAGTPDDISTDLTEIPGFGDLDARRAGSGPVASGGPEACPGAVPAMTQVAPASAVWALQEAGFSLRGRVNVGRAAGSHRGFWFGTVHDAVIRIRPGRTDVRVAARDGRRHGGEACRLATRISIALRTVQ